MNKILKFLKLKTVIITLSIITAILVSLPFITYLYILPNLISNSHFINFAKKELKKQLDVELIIENPKLQTSLTPKISFEVELFSLSKNSKSIIQINNFETNLSFNEILKKKITLNKISSNNIYIDTNELLNLIPQEEKKEEQKPFDWTIDWFNSILNIENIYVTYKQAPDLLIDLYGKNIFISDQISPKYIHFDIKAKLQKKNEKINILLTDKNKTYIKDNKFFINNLDVLINKSKLNINGNVDSETNFDTTISSKNFDLKNIVRLINSNTLIPDGAEYLAFFKDIYGNFDFSINLKNDDISGEIKVHKTGLKLTPIYDMPVKISNGRILIGKKDITLENFKATFATSNRNKLEASGSIKDYMKNLNANVVLKGYTSNNFTKNYVSKLANIPIELTGDSRTIVMVNATPTEQKINAYFKIDKGQDILFDKTSITPKNFDRAILAEMTLKGTLLDINKIDYYISRTINKNSKLNPVIKLAGKADIATGALKEFGFDFFRPLPSEFLNVLIGQRFFRKGLIDGNIKYLNYGKTPTISGTFRAEDVTIPSQRLRIKNAKLYTDTKNINLISTGKFRRSNYDFNGKIKNEILFPIVIRDVNLTVDEIDMERLINSMAQTPYEDYSVLKGRAARSLKLQEGPKNINDTETGNITINNFNQIVEKYESLPKLSILGMRVSNPTDLKNYIKEEKLQEQILNTIAEEENNDDSNEAYTFNPNMLIVEKCKFLLKHGSYKEIEFGNLNANLTLDKNGLLKIISNKFDIAKGTSALRILCDLKNQKYNIHLGAKSVDANILATNLLNLGNEISGKGSAIIDFSTDNTFKLNGSIVFNVKDGTINKLGYIEYILNFVSIFRNPLAMISPTTFIDIVNIPDGIFKNISGNISIKDNIIKSMTIKSSSPQLSSFIIGRIDLETMDASLRIYTKFSNKHKGFLGFLRTLSLNNLAMMMPDTNSQESYLYSTEISQLPKLNSELDEKMSQIFLTKVDGDLQNNNFLSSLKKLK